MSHPSGRHFLQIPGPTNVPERVLRAMARPTIDHRGPEFARLGLELLALIKQVFKTKHSVVIFPTSGSGAWEAALVNTLSPGDKVLMFETGQFSFLWQEMAGRLGFDVTYLPGDWRHGVDADAIESKLREDRQHQIKAVGVVHNETSTGVASNVAAVRKAMDRAGHPALLMVDTISSLASIDYRHDEWGVDVGIGGSQKGLMHEEGLDNVLRRHRRHGEATRAAVRAWRLEVLCLNPAEYSSSSTSVVLPPGQNADELRKLILEQFNMSLGNGLGRLAGKVFRIGHLGDFNDLMLAGTLSGIEMGLELAGVPHHKGGVQAALDSLAEAAKGAHADAAQVHG